ncbi:HD domain-containing protein [Puniceibacterium sediminis]|uniref:5'-deoxynucleotidase n=1 Tax=Puniceibacterium sediminis TaxID=1608407 RepID=A0A238W4P4_9RHOB|nr:HD domain-containing protein [Puniceibacterium sediminis]SNR41516.1 putative hydrolases of HD superfamily [Puniceibacterium sediminis]
MSSDRISAQMDFLTTADQLKSVSRATTLADGSRSENSAEHSWHVALYALVLGEHAPEGVNTDRVIRMLLLHDLVEIDAGDAPIFGEHDAAALAEQESAAAERLFGLLPGDQGRALRALWDEFEGNVTPDAQFAKALDRFQPPNQNLASGGGSWISYDVQYDTLVARVGSKIAHGAPMLWDWLQPRVAAFFERMR